MPIYITVAVESFEINECLQTESTYFAKHF